MRDIDLLVDSLPQARIGFLSMPATTVSSRASWAGFFAKISGLMGGEIAQRLGCGPATVARDWNFARHWLQEELQA